MGGASASFAHFDPTQPPQAPLFPPATIRQTIIDLLTAKGVFFYDTMGTEVLQQFGNNELKLIHRDHVRYMYPKVKHLLK